MWIPVHAERVENVNMNHTNLSQKQHMKNWMKTNQTSLYIMSSREYGSNV